MHEAYVGHFSLYFFLRPNRTHQSVSGPNKMFNNINNNKDEMQSEVVLLYQATIICFYVFIYVSEYEAIGG